MSNVTGNVFASGSKREGTYNRLYLRFVFIFIKS